jgi:hypothetical protein
MRNVTAIDLGGGGDDDFSRWTFTYSQDYQLIKEGVNELTAKISCFGDGSNPVSEWHRWTYRFGYCIHYRRFNWDRWGRTRRAYS